MERRPPVGTRASAKPHIAQEQKARGRLGTPTSGRHARERETSADDAALCQLEFRTPFQSRMARPCTPRICAVILCPRCATGDSSTCAFRCAVAQRCRPEAGVPSRPRASAQAAIRAFRCAAAQRCRPEVGVPSRPRAFALAAVGLSLRCRAAVPAGGRRSKPSPRRGVSRPRCPSALRVRTPPRRGRRPPRAAGPRPSRDPPAKPLPPPRSRPRARPPRPQGWISRW